MGLTVNNHMGAHCTVNTQLVFRKLKQQDWLGIRESEAFELQTLTPDRFTMDPRLGCCEKPYFLDYAKTKHPTKTEIAPNVLIATLDYILCFVMFVFPRR